MPRVVLYRGVFQPFPDLIKSPLVGHAVDHLVLRDALQQPFQRRGLRGQVLIIPQCQCIFHNINLLLASNSSRKGSP